MDFMYDGVFYLFKTGDFFARIKFYNSSIKVAFGGRIIWINLDLQDVHMRYLCNTAPKDLEAHGHSAALRSTH